MKYKYILSLVIFIHLLNVGNGQNGLCPSNLDFEQGDFGGWVCKTGSVAVVGGINTITWTATGPVAGRQTIISAATAGVDPYGGFPQMCPNGSSYCVKLGNDQTQAQAEGMSYTYTIPANVTVFSMFFNYAVVFQDPGHTPEQQPRFRARIFDVTDNTPITCVTFDFTASASLPGFRMSRVGQQVLYKDWTPITLNLTAYAGKTIQLEFITSDCTQGGHFGYAYVDVNTNCNGAIQGSTICPGDNSITLTAPFGFQSYEWYSDNTFTNLLATTQTLPLNPPPAVGTIFPVIVTPYPSFGCKDTLYADISVAQKPVSRAGPDMSVCKYQQAQIGGAPIPGYNYVWAPANLVSNPTIANPMATPDPAGPAQFIVTTTDILTGCSSMDTTIVSSISVDNSIRTSGVTDFCDGTPVGATLFVNNTSTAVQWFDDNNNPVPGATNFTYQPTITGKYWAQVTQFGCMDSTARIAINTHVLPVASFTSSSDTGCVTKNAFLFTNTSSSSDNASMSYTWRFSDGDMAQTQDATKTFINTGTYTARLITTTSFGCMDSIDHSVLIVPNGAPDFTWDSICTGRPVIFKNLSNESGSSLVKYNWDFKNTTVSVLKDPLPVLYTDSAHLDVSLQLTALGCENDPKTISHSVQVNYTKPGIRYRDWTMPLGSSKWINVRGDVGKIYNWRPQVQLDNYTSRYVQFFATNDDVKYLIDITDGHTCVTTDTMLMQVLKTPGYYLATAFTPNGDGLNDVLKPYLVGMKSLKSFSVFNRWGHRIYYTTQYGEGWDGKYLGDPQNPGVYIWMLEYITNDDKPLMAKGTVTLVR